MIRLIVRIVQFNRKVTVIGLWVLVLSIAPGYSRAEMAGGNNSSGHKAVDPGAGCHGQSSPFGNEQINQWTAEIVGIMRVDCYVEMFRKESSVNSACAAWPYRMTNPPGIGLCMIEGKRNIRAANRAGTACDVEDDQLDGKTEEGVKQQIKCCQDMMNKHGPKYFATVRSRC
jgi:hypothetical protein